MNNIHIIQMPAFKKAYKKLHAKEKILVDQSIKKIRGNPLLGIEKKGDLKGVFIYKFKIHLQERLLAYEWNPNTRILLALGLHENFYRDLK